MGAYPVVGSFGIDWLPEPFPKITFKSLTIPNTSAPVRWTGFGRVSASPLKCLPSFLQGCLCGRKWWYGYTFFLQLSRYILSVSSKQRMHALYPLFVCPEMLLRAGQSLMVTNSNARRSNSSCLCSAHVKSTPGFLNPDAVYYAVHRNPRNIIFARHNRLVSQNIIYYKP